MLLFAGCVVHAPMSEVLMFREKESKDGRTYNAKNSYALLSYSGRFYDHSKLENEADRRFGSQNEHDLFNYEAFTTSFILMSDSLDWVSLNIPVGNSFGMDATVKILPDLFLTGSYSIATEGIQNQVILQRRMAKGNPVGFSMGVSYIRRQHYFARRGEERFCLFSCNTRSTFFTRSVGLRSVFTLSPHASYGSPKIMTYLTGSVNYDFEMEDIYPALSFSLAFY